MSSAERLFNLLLAVLAISLGALQAFSHTHMLSAPDAISYLEIGKAYFEGDWRNALNAYWSPLYSVLLGFAYSLFDPSPAQEFLLVRNVNFGIYLFSLIAFLFFWREFTLYYGRKSGVKIPESIWTLAGYSLFLWSSLRWNAVWIDTPDQCTAVLIYAAAGLLLRIERVQPASSTLFLLFGATLACAYFAKAAMFFVSMIFLAVLFLVVRNGRRVSLSLLAFLIVAGPFVAALSWSKQRFTVGDSGKLNYAWFVNPGNLLPTHWRGERPGFGDAIHPTRKIFEIPAVYEFAHPIAGTYPPWYDPSYWYEGLQLNFDFQKQLSVIAKNASFYYRYFLRALLAGIVILLIITGTFASAVRVATKRWELLIPAAGALALFLIGTDLYAVNISHQPSTRYVFPFVVLLFCGAFSSVPVPNGAKLKRTSIAISAASVLALIVLCYHSSKDVRLLLDKPTNFHLQIARAVGIQEGSRVAIIGDEDDHVYWARLARVKIVAQVPDHQTFWKQEPQVQAMVMDKLRAAGAVAAISRGEDEGWRTLEETGYVMLSLAD